jgi:hypothetical protein
VVVSKALTDLEIEEGIGENGYTAAEIGGKLGWAK